MLWANASTRRVCVTGRAYSTLFCKVLAGSMPTGIASESTIDGKWGAQAKLALSMDVYSFTKHMPSKGPCGFDGTSALFPVLIPWLCSNHEERAETPVLLRPLQSVTPSVSLSCASRWGIAYPLCLLYPSMRACGLYFCYSPPALHMAKPVCKPLPQCLP